MSTGRPSDTSPPGFSALRVRRAHEQVYDDLRARILAGNIPRGERLPPELMLAREYGVSRGTVREALRALVAEKLICTTRGPRGGSFVTLPTVEDLSEFMQRNLELLSFSEDVTLEQFLEARALVEVFAARAAAQDSTPMDLARLRATIVIDEGLSAHERYLRNREFRQVLAAISGNPLVVLAAQPIFFVLSTRLLAPSSMSPSRAASAPNTKRSSPPPRTTTQTGRNMRCASTLRIWRLSTRASGKVAPPPARYRSTPRRQVRLGRARTATRPAEQREHQQDARYAHADPR